jgi:polygalacturonase
MISVEDFGATGDGVTIDSESINRAIEAAHRSGGGEVRIPAGRYLCFSIRLRSHVTLVLESGSVLVAAVPGEAGTYDVESVDPLWKQYEFQDYGHSHWKDSLIWGESLEGVCIQGTGMIDGSSLDKWDQEGVAGRANKSIALKNCRDVSLRDFRCYQGGHFVVLATGVDDMLIDNVRIDTNRDGINVDCCRNVRISNCVINTPNDDAIVLKSSYALGKIRDTENVCITNCQVMGYDMGSFFDGTYRTEQTEAPDLGGVTGRIKLGTESTGGFRNITISNCTFEHCRGLALETVDGGDLEDICISNLTMRDVRNAPIFLRRAARMRGPAGRKPGVLRRVRIQNIVATQCDGDFAVMIMGVPGFPVEQVVIRDFTFESEGGRCKELAGRVVPEMIDGYPDPHQFGPMPAYGFFIRHAKDIKLLEGDLRLIAPDARPCIFSEDAENLEVRNVKPIE